MVAASHRSSFFIRNILNGLVILGDVYMAAKLLQFEDNAKQIFRFFVISALPCREVCPREVGNHLR